MKIQLNSSDLLRALTAVQKVMSSKNSLSILDTALLSQTGGKYFITGGDTVNSLTMPLNLTLLEGDFQPVCLNHKVMQSALSGLPSQPLTIVIEDLGNKSFRCEVKYTKGSFTVTAQPADDYPPMLPINDINTQYEIPSAIMLNAIKNAVLNTASDELRMVMNGIYFDAEEDGKVTLVASDGHKMYEEIYHPGIPFFKQGGARGFILPKTVVSAIDTAFRGTQSILITANDNMTMFQAGDATLYARAIEGRYPNYRAVIPHNMPYHLTLNRKELYDAVKRTAIFASEATKLICLEYKNGTVSLRSEDIDFATSACETILPVDHNCPETFRIGFKSDGMLTQIGFLPSENITLHMEAGNRPMLIRTDGDGTVERIPKTDTEAAVKTSVTCLVMPMMLNE